jgi:hypothetical protein
MTVNARELKAPQREDAGSTVAEGLGFALKIASS